MENKYYNIKDNCRKGLIKHLLKAIASIQTIDSPLVLDAGCGTGVPAIALALNYNANVIAVDIDTNALNQLKRKIETANLSKQITAINCSVYDLNLQENTFDIILAEGLLNEIGFRKGFQHLVKLLKRNGHFIIHDEYRNHNKKIEFIENSNCKVLDSYKLDDHIWWNDYYKDLEKEIYSPDNSDVLNLFSKELKEIRSIKKDPSQYNSIYYIIKKT
jgi:cyclopropane fatty-acyl-phospholipid synthase-like methyltransferase